MNIERFTKYKDQDFKIDFDGDLKDARLREVVSLGDGKTHSLIFQTINYLEVKEQRIYSFKWPDGSDTEDLFIVPVSKDEQGVKYEVVFN
ncbi:DUF6916 family protein [Jiulongibacter sp. NS-SX5]|uniref:DUF6916 family protein n=1 Tax=Jiulongibacter sp. NS-SX5 TaxID=3463854 RepID=UPI004059AAB2